MAVAIITLYLGWAAGAFLAASTLLLATMYLRMAARLEPVLFLRAVMAVAIITLYLGWAAGAFLALGAAAAGMVVVWICGFFHLRRSNSRKVLIKWNPAFA